MTAIAAASPDFASLVSAQFASRPTLRQVLSRQILQVLIDQYPLIAIHRPELVDADRINLALPTADGQRIDLRPLVDVMLHAHLRGHLLSSATTEPFLPYLMLGQKRFFAIDDPFETTEGDLIEVQRLIAPLSDLLLTLEAHFDQAQIDYWRAPGDLGASRDRCLQLAIRSALLHNLALQRLDERQRSCLLGLLSGDGQQSSVFFLEIELQRNGEVYREFLTDLFVIGQWDEADVILWCRPCGVVWAFDDDESLLDALAADYLYLSDYQALSCHRHELEGDPFVQLTALMQEQLLQRVHMAWSRPPDSVEALERISLALTDPAHWFIPGYRVQAQVAGTLPARWSGLDAQDSFACQSALFQLALAQAQSDGTSALDDVLDLHSYASAQLREQLLVDHPIDANYFPDDLLLELTHAWGVPGGAGAGPGDGTLQKRTVTLTQFAIDNLASLHGATITAITHRSGQLIMAWLTADYVKALVERVDIGGDYPRYVAAQLDDPAGYGQRAERFARQWRSAFLASALQARLEHQLTEPNLQAVAEYCGGRLDTQLPSSMLMPFALRREPGSESYDQVMGMYVLYVVQTHSVVLYRPLYAQAPVREFASIEAMMAAVREEADLQRSLLDWLPAEVRKVYDHGGFVEPHLGRPILDTQLLPEPVEPARFWARFWRTEVDAQLYQANRDLLVELGERESLSTAESRWALLVEGAWLLFDVTSLVVRGPVAQVLWLVQMFNAASADVRTIVEGSAFERSAAVVDMLMNLVMALAHARTPSIPLVAIERSPGMDLLEPTRGSLSASTARPQIASQGKVYLSGALVKADALLDFSFTGSDGFNRLPAQRLRDLEALRSAKVLQPQALVERGAAAGLYLIEGEHYVGLRGDAYRIAISEEGVRVVGADGRLGPWLERDASGWRIDVGQRLRGGMPKSRIALKREQNLAEEARIRAEDARLTGIRNGLGQRLDKHLAEEDKSNAKIEELQALEQPDERQRELLDLHLQIRRAQRNVLAKDLKDLIEHDLQHDALLRELGAVKLSSDVMVDALSHQRSILTQGVIAACEQRYNLLATLINEEDIDVQRRAIAIFPETDAEQLQYQRLVASLERVEKLGEELVELAVRFDGLLERTIKDDVIVYRDEQDRPINKRHELDKVIELRRHNAIDVEMRLLEDLGELCLDRLKGPTEEDIARLDEMLVSDALRSAGSAHGELASSDLSEEERVAVLNDVIEAYEETIGSAEYLAAVKPAAIRQDKLQRFLGSVRRLKALASADMNASVREIELAEPAPRRTPVYAPRGGIRRVVRTQRGRNVVGVESTGADGEAVLEQKDSHDNVLRTFRRQASQWQEVDDRREEGPSPAPSPQPSVVRSRMKKLLGEVQPTIAIAKRFFANDEPLGLSTVIDLHSKDLQRGLASLPRSGRDAELVEQANRAVELLESSKRELLTVHYLRTQTPTLNALRYLHGIGEISIARSERRIRLAASDFLDTYEIRQVSGRKLWEAHFHYLAEDTPDRDFAKGHLKLWEQRKLGQQAQVRAARRSQVLKIYRGQLRKGDVEGIIPFE